MYISHKSNVLQTFHETEWQCRRNAKGLSKSEYWTWLTSVTSGDPPVGDYSGETGYAIDVFVANALLIMQSYPEYLTTTTHKARGLDTK